MKSRKNINHLKKKKHSRKNMKGGFLFGSRKVASSSECDINNLSSLSKDMGDGQDPLVKMRTNYQKCCPKDFIGNKNSSPYCKQLNMNYNSLSQYKSDISGYYGDEIDVSKIKQTMSSSIPSASSQKPWYKFWGGKRTMKCRTK